MAIDKIKMFRQASAFTSFHKKLGVLIEPYLDESWTVLDAGCGLGLLDLAIAPSAAHITAVDIDRAAIADLKAHIDAELRAGRGPVGRIEPVCADVRGLQGEWDVVLMSFFGADLAEAERLIGMAKRRVIFIVHGLRPNGRFDPAPSETGGRRTVEELEIFLEEKGHRFRKSIVDLQFGQPFRTIEDIHAFLESYKMDPVEIPDMTGYLPNEGAVDIKNRELSAAEDGFDIGRLVVSTEERIIKTDRYDYPYYLPRNMCVGIISVVK
ncbi:MAG: class I SAM-dependent methyltransferase [Clostridiales Family XIII bacterium]|nr:class I SAM-dependent methyltransferase [Clostridiales Family XIII bacterium]